MKRGDLLKAPSKTASLAPLVCDPADVDVCAEEVNQLHDVCIQRPVAMASCDGGSVSEPGISLYV